VNFAAVRRLAVSLLRQDKTLKRGAKCKRMARLTHRCIDVSAGDLVFYEGSEVGA
jgi:hypothetical protein